MLDSWLLTTHGVALFPMGVFIWSWKRRKDASSILPEDEVFTTDYDYDNWALLDGYACSSLIFTTVLYGSRVREPQFYITSFAVENIVLIVKLWENLNQELIIN